MNNLLLLWVDYKIHQEIYDFDHYKHANLLTKPPQRDLCNDILSSFNELFFLQLKHTLDGEEFLISVVKIHHHY